MSTISKQLNNRISRCMLMSDEFKRVYRQEKQPKHTLMYFNREIISIMWLYPNKKEWSHLSYRIIHRIILTHLTLMLSAIIFSLTEASLDVLDIGDRLIWIIGIMLIKSKIWYSHFYANEIDTVIREFESFNRKFWAKKHNDEILRLQRNYFVLEYSVHACCLVILWCFCLPIFVQPLWSEQTLPFHATFPFELHKPDKHPVTHAIIYFAQCAMTFHNLNAILQLDLLVVTPFTQTSLNLKILCTLLRQLGKASRSDESAYREDLREAIEFHQNIISVVEKTNKIFYGGYIIQLVASFILISLATFEALAAKNDPKIAIRFEILLLITFIQLSVWCMAGDMVYNQSLEVACAAFDAPEWHERSAATQRDLMFVIQRAQKPLIYVAQPFLPFTLGTYMIILKQCYTILALLNESMD